ncbi:GIY-YIG nuclease family protein [Leptolyngbya ohadii]|uniref:GIY-YIG nuclease family protein n=1 Tax=Leptolyngbya ohadii TaxID=1962290 RepID=UPI000B5A12BE|nr:GIY-YIG nuclease family protein [Leptolyngbya ohadii]
MVEQKSLGQEADRLLVILVETPFKECYVLSREFHQLPNGAGLYAIKHRTMGILYIGKSGNVRSRLRGGHKALGWAFIDRLDPDDVRIAVARLSFPWARLSLQLEQIVLRQVRPPYNDRIAQEE